MNAFLCGLRTSVFFVIREAMGGFSFNRCSGLGVGHAFETQGIFSRRAAEFAEVGRKRACASYNAKSCGSLRSRVEWCCAAHSKRVVVPGAATCQTPS